MGFSISRFAILVLVPVLILVGGCSTPTPAPTPIPTDTPVPSPTPIPLDAWVSDGDKLARDSDFEGAEATYQRAIAADAGYAPAYAGLSQLYGWQAGREKEALAQAEKATELGPEDAGAWVALAAAHIGLQDPAEAVKAAEKAAELDADRPDVQAILARAYGLDRRMDLALKAALKAVELGPESADAHYALATAYWHTADFARARAATEKAVALEPGFVVWQAILGGMLDRLLLYDQATAQLEKALDVAPDYVPALVALAEAHLKQRDYDKAQKAIDQAVKVAPDVAAPYVTWGKLYLGQEDYDAAIAKLQKAVDLDPNDWTAQALLAMARLQRGDCESAAGSFQDLSTSHPRFADLRVGEALAKICLGDASRAIELARKAAEMEPFSAYPQAVLAEVYSAQQRWDDATRAYVEALRLSPAGADVHTTAGLMYVYQSQNEPAKAEFSLANRLDPQEVGGHSGLCVIYLSESESAKALPECKSALDLQAENADRRRQWAIALLAEGRTQEAVDVLKEVVAGNRDDAYNHYYLGLGYRDLKDYPNALKELETFQSLTETDDFRMEQLIAALKDGWVLRQEKAIADLQAASQEMLDRPVDVRVETSDALTRTLALKTRLKSTDEANTGATAAFNLAMLAALFAPRVEPAIDGGALVRIEDARGQLALTVSADAADLKRFGDGSLSGQEFSARLKYPTDEKGAVELTDNQVKTTRDGVAEIRGLDAKKDIPLQRLTEDELTQRMDESTDVKVREATRADEALLRLLDLIGPEVDLAEISRQLAEEQVIGFYDPTDESLFLVKGKAQGLLDRLAVAHEYVHALQDQNFGLERLEDEKLDADQRLAFTALIEGDASLAMVNYAQEQVPVQDLARLASLTQGGIEQEMLKSAPAALRETMVFPYQEGLAFVSSLQAAGGWEAVNDAYKKPPLSTEQILHPERYRSGDGPKEVTLPDVAGKLGGSWNQVSSDVMGELGLRLLLSEEVGPAAAGAAAKGWGGDRYALLRDGTDGPYALALKTTWDDPEEAAEFMALTRVMMGHRAGYDEAVKDLVAAEPVRTWKSEDGVWIARHDGATVDLAVGPSEAVAEQILAAMSGS